MTDDADDNDPLLLPLLRAAGSARDERVADLLAEHALPVVDAILSSRLRRLGPHATAMLEDLRGDVVVRLLHRIERLLLAPSVSPIHSLRDYAAVVSYHRLDDFVRSTQPARVALANRVRYLLNKDTELAVWSVHSSDALAGFVAWRRDNRAPVSIPPGLARELAGNGPWDTSPRGLRALLARVLAGAGGPIELAGLVSLVATVLHVTESAVVPLPVPDLASGQPDPLTQLEATDYLRRLWAEIVALPVRQRTALLLNLRDPRGDSVARLLPLTGIAGPLEIARALELDPESFTRLWAELPLEDLDIAALIGATRQQVINLRKSARERLARRMARLERFGGVALK